MPSQNLWCGNLNRFWFVNEGSKHTKSAATSVDFNDTVYLPHEPEAGEETNSSWNENIVFKYRCRNSSDNMHNVLLTSEEYLAFFSASPEQIILEYIEVIWRSPWPQRPPEWLLRDNMQMDIRVIEVTELKSITVAHSSVGHFPHVKGNSLPS